MAPTGKVAKPMTSRQVKYQYKKNGYQVSEDEKRRLERLNERDERAQRIKEAEERRKLAKKKREERESKEREIRKQLGKGLATQIAGYSHTQLKTKSVMEAWVGLKKAKDQEKTESEVQKKLEAEQEELDREPWDNSEEEFELDAVEDPLPTENLPNPREVAPKPEQAHQKCAQQSDQWDEDGLDDETLAELSDQLLSDPVEEAPRLPTPKSKSPQPAPQAPGRLSIEDLQRSSLQENSSPLTSWPPTPEITSSPPPKSHSETGGNPLGLTSGGKVVKESTLYRIPSAKPENPEFTRIHGPLNKTIEGILESLPEDLVELLSVDESTNRAWKPAPSPALLHRLSPTWMPPHRLRLKKGCTVQTVQDVYSDKHLLPGYHLWVVKIEKDKLDCTILNGPQVWQTVTVPRLTFPATYQNDPRKTYKRVQFPVKVCPHYRPSVLPPLGDVPGFPNEIAVRAEASHELSKPDPRSNLKRRSSTPESELPVAKRKAQTPTSARRIKVPDLPPSRTPPRFLQPQKSASPIPKPGASSKGSNLRASNSPQPELPPQKMVTPAPNRSGPSKVQDSRVPDTVIPESLAPNRAVQMLKLKGQFKVPSVPASRTPQREVAASKTPVQPQRPTGYVQASNLAVSKPPQRELRSSRTTAQAQNAAQPKSANLPQMKAPTTPMPALIPPPQPAAAPDCWDDFDFLESGTQIARELSEEPGPCAKPSKPIKRVSTQDVDITIGDLNDLPQSTPKPVDSKQASATKTNEHSGQKPRALDAVLLEATTYHTAHNTTPSRAPRSMPPPQQPRQINQNNNLKRKSTGELMPPPPAKRQSPGRDTSMVGQTPKPAAVRPQLQPPKPEARQWNQRSMGPPPLPSKAPTKPAPSKPAPSKPLLSKSLPSKPLPSKPLPINQPRPRPQLPRQPAQRTTPAPPPPPLSFREFGISTQDVVSMVEDDDVLSDSEPDKKDQSSKDHASEDSIDSEEEEEERSHWGYLTQLGNGASSQEVRQRLMEDIHIDVMGDF